MRKPRLVILMSPLSAEWEDSGTDREYGARGACEFVRKIDFKPSDIKYDAAIKF